MYSIFGTKKFYYMAKLLQIKPKFRININQAHFKLTQCLVFDEKTNHGQA